jgi:hypothetical protein
MPKMTDEEADYWDEYFTKNPPEVSGDGKSGFFARHKASRMVALDDLSTNYLTAKAIAVHKTPAELISELVRKEIVSSLNEEPAARTQG